jgi:hypothetical protein
MFRTLLAYLQEALHQRHLVYCMRVMSVGCIRIGVELVSVRVSTRTDTDEQLMLETCRDS